LQRGFWSGRGGSRFRARRAGHLPQGKRAATDETHGDRRSPSNTMSHLAHLLSRRASLQTSRALLPVIVRALLLLGIQQRVQKKLVGSIGLRTVLTAKPDQYDTPFLLLDLHDGSSTT